MHRVNEDTDVALFAQGVDFDRLTGCLTTSVMARRSTDRFIEMLELISQANHAL